MGSFTLFTVQRGHTEAEAEWTGWRPSSLRTEEQQTGLPLSSQLSGPVYICLNEKCETVCLWNQCELFVRGQQLKSKKLLLTWNMSCGTAETKTKQNSSKVCSFPTRMVYGNITPLRKCHPTVHRRLSIPTVCKWWAATAFIPASQIDVCNWSSNLWLGLSAG